MSFPILLHLPQYGASQPIHLLFDIIFTSGSGSLVFFLDEVRVLDDMWLFEVQTLNPKLDYSIKFITNKLLMAFILTYGPYGLFIQE